MRKTVKMLDKGNRDLNVWTIGHSTRPIEEFATCLKAHQVEKLVDVRTVPRSRHNPQFNSDVLQAYLEKIAIAYVHFPGLGGLRRPRPDSPNGAWRNASFRGYADYMLTPPFAASLSELIDAAGGECVCMMCAEAVPWRCHRSLIADALTVHGFEVRHIMSATKSDRHALKPWAVVDGTRITYPAPETESVQTVSPELSPGAPVLEDQTCPVNSKLAITLNGTRKRASSRAASKRK